MKRAVVLSILCGLFIGILAPAFEIKNEWINPPDGYGSRDIPFIFNKAGSEIALPVRSLYLGHVINKERTIAAINYHETSDYNGVDLVVSKGGEVAILQDILHLIETTLEQRKILPVQPWDRMDLAVESISGDKARCVFRGKVLRTDTFVERRFTIIVGSSDNPLDLQVTKK